MRALCALHLLTLHALRTLSALRLLTFGTLRAFGALRLLGTAAATLGLLLLLRLAAVGLLGHRGGQSEAGNAGDQYHLAGHE